MRVSAACGRRRSATSPRVIPSALTAAVVAAAGFTGSAPVAHAAPDLSGRWISDSLRDNQIGYYVVLRDAPGVTKFRVNPEARRARSDDKDPDCA